MRKRTLCPRDNRKNKAPFACPTREMSISAEKQSGSETEPDFSFLNKNRAYVSNGQTYEEGTVSNLKYCVALWQPSAVCAFGYLSPKNRAICDLLVFSKSRLALRVLRRYAPNPINGTVRNSTFAIFGSECRLSKMHARLPNSEKERFFAKFFNKNAEGSFFSVKNRKILPKKMIQNF